MFLVFIETAMELENHGNTVSVYGIHLWSFTVGES